MIEWFTRNSVAANILMAAIVALGINSALNVIILQEFPDFPSRQISVTVSYPGSTPREVEQAVITRLEEELFDVEGIEEMTSRATSNSGTVTLEIEEGYSLATALDAIKNIFRAQVNCLMPQVKGIRHVRLYPNFIHRVNENKIPHYRSPHVFSFKRRNGCRSFRSRSYWRDPFVKLATK